MKFFATFILVACVVGFSAAGLSRKKVEHLKSTILECGAKKGATQAEIDEVLERKPPSTHTAKCVEACTIDSAGIMKDKQIDPEGVEKLTLTVYGDAERAKVAKELANECVGITDDDPCEAGYKILVCLHEKADARGLSTDD